ncbi:MAG: methyltransferase domain-containing protein [Desulfobacteraceae bacterium]|jgi:D-alanine-D-alanine ligase
MSIEVNKDWWKTLFDSIYLKTDARTVCDETLTRREVDLLSELIPLRPAHKILDLCGGHGRHSLELCRRGFAHCTVFDYSTALLGQGAQTARRLNFSVDFVQGDARRILMQSGNFHHVLILGNSLGYVGSSGADQQIVNEAHRLLDQSGWIAIDVTDGSAVRDHFNPNAWHEIGEDLVVCRQRELHGNQIRAREMVLDKRTGLVRDRNYGMRLYEGESLKALVSDAGFGNVRLHRDFEPYWGDGDVGFMDHRIIVTAQKL